MKYNIQTWILRTYEVSSFGTNFVFLILFNNIIYYIEYISDTDRLAMPMAYANLIIIIVMANTLIQNRSIGID